MPVTHTNRAIAAFKKAYGRGPSSEIDEAWISGWIVGFHAGERPRAKVDAPGRAKAKTSRL